MLKLLLPASALIAATPAAAQDFQSTEALDTLVAQFTGKAIGEEGGARTAVDRRLRLAACAAPQLEWRTDAHDAVVVRCMAPSWRIFVPVDAAPAAQAQAAAAQGSTRPADQELVIRRGDPITVEAGAQGFSITRDGIAMSDAAPGARLLVRVEEREPPIQAVAVQPGRATLPGWTD
ncbi:flagella basal body P-ring formation protein FlgA [Sphingosinithalassobacter sp. CS137]|uniref:flagella basal body P-ring formation protein FlgA n=1 Tax=Sphingosinithalassobacter sp. CS137 TaxID=2762748 RepID=UPI00165D5447|nr:flagella basal body P-ring formation protein FlgA [Sphingosinithalassobacter sp. CS137]